jgi:hypothetical protein
MKKQEINEYLAERLFKVKMQIGTPLGSYTGLGLSADMGEIDPIRPYCPDYHTEWWRVVEKLFEKDLIDTCEQITIYPPPRLWYAQIGYSEKAKNGKLTDDDCGKTLGEAVCRAAVKYLKAKEVV